MYWGIDLGHQLKVDTGANGIKFEDNLNKLVGDKVIEYLKALGEKVFNVTPLYAKDLGESLYLRTITANRENVDTYVSIHFNAGGGIGTEVYAISKAGKEIAQRVVDEIASLGFVNRGVKDGSHLYVLRQTTAKAILIECAFVDSKEDMDRLDIDKMARAIVKGLTGKEAPSITPPDVQRAKVPSGNTNVATLQGLLNRNGLRDKYNNPLVVDGIIGEKTLSAFPLVAKGSSFKDIVRFLQSILITKGYSCGMAGADGEFGNGTYVSVLAFQNNNGLQADGKIGKETLKALLN